MDKNIVIALSAGIGISLLLLWPKLQARYLRNRDLSGLELLLPEKMRGKASLLLYFWSPSCTQCKKMTPVVRGIAAQRDDVLAVDVFQQPELAQKLAIRATPTLVSMRDGKVTGLEMGGKSEAQIRKMLETP